MMRAQNQKKVLPIFASSTTNAGTASGNIDTIGYDYCSIDVLMDTSNNTTNNPSVLKISESDDTVVSNFTDIVGFRGDTDFTIPAAVTAATQVTAPFAVIGINCATRKRYLKLSVSPVTTQTITAIASLTRGGITPVGATAQNALVVVNG